MMTPQYVPVPELGSSNWMERELSSTTSTVTARGGHPRRRQPVSQSISQLVSQSALPRGVHMRSPTDAYVHTYMAG
eukprot:3101775-Pyramimonas_sp.AAC.1